jgi:hypothetical protein
MTVIFKQGDSITTYFGSVAILSGHKTNHSSDVGLLFLSRRPHTLAGRELMRTIKKEQMAGSEGETLGAAEQLSALDSYSRG